MDGDEQLVEEERLGVSGGAGEQKEAEKALSKMLGKRLRVSITDGRVVRGTFACVDNGCNIILKMAEVLKGEPSTEDNPTADLDCKLEFRKHVGIIMIPGAHAVRVCIENESTQQQAQQGDERTPVTKSRSAAEEGSDEKVFQQLEGVLNISSKS